jgi:hypothetical protein
MSVGSGGRNEKPRRVACGQRGEVHFRDDHGVARARIDDQARNA